MIQISEEYWDAIQERLNPPPRPRVSESELAGRYESARRCGPRPGTLWRHKGTGGLYQADGVALVEATLEPVVVYRPALPDARGAGPVYTRPLDEFRERFVDATGAGRDDPRRDGADPEADRPADPRNES